MFHILNKIKSSSPSKDGAAKLAEIKVDELKKASDSHCVFHKYQAEFAAKWWERKISWLKCLEEGALHDAITKEQQAVFRFILYNSIWEACQNPILDAQRQSPLTVGLGSKFVQDALHAARITVDLDKDKCNMFAFVCQNGTVTFREGHEVGNIFYSKSGLLMNLVSFNKIDIQEALKISENLTDHQADFIDYFAINNFIDSNYLSIKEGIQLSNEFSMESVKNLASHLYNYFLDKRISMRDALSLNKDQVQILNLSGIHNFIVTDNLDMKTAINLTKEQAAILDDYRNYNIIGSYEHWTKCKVDIGRLLHAGPEYLESPVALSLIKKHKDRCDFDIKEMLALQTKLKEAGKGYLIEVHQATEARGEVTETRRVRL